ncbi:type VI secretion system membrane subunit TssM [Rhodanobacter sp. KK11]|uniref:type VI secretion system membrane subunit TssM n=1 Tax=Rhodanobacter sp. KK11 TaxID=3083255 RepID=UPI002965D2B0|nr:type VI secretion system membrane subunit TssM [Rhodanobacter sp. KK11]MDW2982062.1 type VI secretion system membrane subunit TssM [Rhodanobacter sp. KK11]
MGKLLALFKSRLFITLVGLLLLSLLIWFGGPYLGIGESQPLASPVVRLLVIIVIVVVWAVWLQVQQMRVRGKAKQMASDLSGQGAPTGGERDDRAANERAQLQGRFQEAVDTLRKNRSSGTNLYALPWYVVIGPPGSGKSTLLQNSGLNFPLSNKFGKEAIRGVGGTRNCDWWFTDEAVFLDTAGRYTTQDSDRGADASAWAEFLDLLRKYRKRRPINGVIVAMSLSDLLTLDASGRQQHILAVRQRLDELAKHLRIGVPAYLVFTKCDLVAGFTEFFDDLNPQLRSQVWGMSFPVDKTMDGTAAKQFLDEFNLLLERLNTRILDRLHGERDRSRRAAILSFPQQLGALREITRQFVEGVFTGHQYDAPLLLRGAYFTSGTQEGTPIDRMMGAVARTFGLDASRLHAPGAQSRTFFVERLLREVLFKESGFAGTDPKLERQKVLLQAASYAGVLLVCALLVFGLASSYRRNGSYLAQVQTALQKYPAQSDLSLAPNQQAYFAMVLERLESLSGVVDVADQYKGDVPLSMRFGLYQGNAVGGEVRDAYFRELNGLLLPGVASQFRAGLAANATDPQTLYYYLKGYLMLGQPQHLDRDQIVALAGIEWRRLFPNDPVLQKALGKHFDALVGHEGRVRALSLDDSLVEQARNTLRTADLASLIYGNIKLTADNGAYPPLRLDKELGLLGNVYRRKSGAPLSEPLPALFTQPVFKDEVDKGIELAVTQFAADDWVFGASKIDALQKARLAQQVLALYEQDYIKAWDGLLADLELQPIGNIQDASTIAAKLAGPNSPMKLLLKVVRDNTSDLMRAPPADAADKAEDVAKKLAQKKATQTALARALAQAGASAGASGADAAAEKPGQAISDHFEQVNKLSDGAPGAAPIDQTLKTLDDLSKTLLTMGDFSNAAGQPNPQLLMAQQAAAQLPPPAAGWFAALTGKSQALVASSTKGALDDQYQQAVAKDCADYTRGRYPFSPSSSNDIPLQNFGEMFGYGGRFDSFYNQTAGKLIDASGRNWQWKTGPGAVSGSAGMLAQLQGADRIKQMFFRSGNMPEVDFTLLTPVLDAGIGKLVIEVDGQKYEYQAGGASNVAMKWPGPTPGRVSISAYDPAGALLTTFDYHGDWAFFRALQAANLQKQSDLRFVASFNFGGHVAKVTIQANNLKNPFLSNALSSFRCGG